jgi:hypothetical protein
MTRVTNNSARIQFLFLGRAYYEGFALLRANFEILAKLTYAVDKEKLEELKFDLTKENLKPNERKLGKIKDLCESTNLDYSLYEYLCNYTHSALINSTDVYEIETNDEDHELFALNLGHTSDRTLTINGLTLNNNILALFSQIFEAYLDKKHKDRFNKEIFETRKIPEKEIEILRNKITKIKQIHIEITKTQH